MAEDVFAFFVDVELAFEAVEDRLHEIDVGFVAGHLEEAGVPASEIGGEAIRDGEDKSTFIALFAELEDGFELGGVAGETVEGDDDGGGLGVVVAFGDVKDEVAGFFGNRQLFDVASRCAGLGV